MDLDKAIKQRKSVRNFSKKKPDWRDIVECIDTMRYAPAAGNIPTMKVIVVQDQEKIAKITKACQQPFVGTAQYLVVVCSKPKLLVNAYEDRGKKFNIQQNGAAIENFLLSIENKGLSTCWIGYFVESQVKGILEIPEDADIEAIFPIGYESEIRGEKKQPRKKVELDNYLYFDKYKNKRMWKPRDIYT